MNLIEALEIAADATECGHKNFCLLKEVCRSNVAATLVREHALALRAPIPPVPAGVPGLAAEWVVISVDLRQSVALFWGPARSGYTRDLAKAGRYSEAEAKGLEKCQEDRQEVALSLADAERLAIRCIRDTDVERMFYRRFPEGATKP